MDPLTTNKIIPETILAMKGKTPIPALTAYDYPLAKLLDEAGIPLILVGDSLGMVVLGYPNTTHVTMDEMLHHVRAVARAEPKGLVVADLPYHSYQTPAEAVNNARKLIQAGAQAVKAEGGESIAEQIQAIIQEQIPFLGHLGMLPQSVLEEGKYRIKGKTDIEHQRLLDDAQLLQSLGAFGIVLELVTPPVAAEITRTLQIPTIGIGSGPDCDGQILVTHDLIGAFPWFTPKFAKPKRQVGLEIRSAVQEWMSEIPNPTSTQSSAPASPGTPAS